MTSSQNTTYRTALSANHDCLKPLQHPVGLETFTSANAPHVHPSFTVSTSKPQVPYSNLKKPQEKYLKTNRCQEAGLLPAHPQPGPAPLLEGAGQPGLVLWGQTQPLGCFKASHQLLLSRKPSTAHHKIQWYWYLAFPRAFSPEAKLLCICNATLEGWAVRAGQL